MNSSHPSNGCPGLNSNIFINVMRTEGAHLGLVFSAVCNKYHKNIKHQN